MEYSNNALSPTSWASSPPSSPPSTVVLRPCAACRILRRRCVEKCVLAPYFPPSEPIKFAIMHRLFGASNAIKFLRELPQDQRADAVNSMVYEANARLRDPVYGCAGAICHLQKQINELQAELAKTQAELLNIQCQNSSLIESILKQKLDNDRIENVITSQALLMPTYYDQDDHSRFFVDEGLFGVACEPLLTS